MTTTAALSDRGGYLVTYSDLKSSDGDIPASRIYDELRKALRWYIRPNITLDAGKAIFFYHNRVGIVGYGVVRQSSAITTSDSALIRKLRLEGFKAKIEIADWHTLANPINLRDLVNKLEFIKDKKNWGISLQRSPVRLPAADVRTLIHFREAIR